MRYWLGVVSKQHVQKGILGSFAQACHGKKGPLAKLEAGDGFIYYSPKISMTGSKPCKSFTAIGKVKTGQIYQVKMTPDFHPFRIDIEYFPAEDIPLIDVIHDLELTQERSWGMKLLRGLVEISPADFSIISKAMKVQS